MRAASSVAEEGVAARQMVLKTAYKHTAFRVRIPKCIRNEMPEKSKARHRRAENGRGDPRELAATLVSTFTSAAADPFCRGCRLSPKLFCLQFPGSWG